MTFVELREETDDLAEVWGYKNTRRPPDWPKMVNRAYRELAWAADAIKGPEQTFSTVIGQAEYTLPSVISGNSRDWKTIEEGYFNGTRLRPVDIAVIRRDNNSWLFTSSGTPVRFMLIRPNVIRLHPTPNAVGTVTIFGVQAPVALANDTDVPLLPEYYHTFIPPRAAYHHAKKYVKTAEVMQQLNVLDGEFQAAVSSLRHEVAEENGMDGWRWIAPVEADRVSL